MIFATFKTHIFTCPINYYLIIGNKKKTECHCVNKISFWIQLFENKKKNINTQWKRDNVTLNSLSLLKKKKKKKQWGVRSVQVDKVYIHGQYVGCMCNTV